ncbi:MAG: ArnT family glycosyltransferase [Gammaproteobacteria bacterium]
MFQLLRVRLWIFFLWSALIALSLYIRPLMPIDETRYASVAWEMWCRNDFLVPRLNGEIYSHKPPLLFWLMQLSWRLFGVNEWSLRLISPLFGLATLFLAIPLARALWPERDNPEDLAPLFLLGSGLWIVYGTLTIFDVILSFFVLLGVFCLIKQDRSGVSVKRWALLGLAFGGGALAKGPVILLHILPVALLAPWWSLNEDRIRWPNWYGGLLFSVAIGFIIALSWAIPAGILGGEAYRNAIFFGQVSGRLVNSFAHQFPWWWYLQALPLILLPWLFVKPLWIGLRKITLQDFGIRFCLAWLASVLFAFSLISGKRIHYLLPLLPGLALLLAKTADEIADNKCWRRAHRPVSLIYAVLGLILTLLPILSGYFQLPAGLSLPSPLWGVSLFLFASAIGLGKAADAKQSVFFTGLATGIATLILSGAFFHSNARNYDTKETARQIEELMSEKKEIAYAGDRYHGQYHFTGRLTGPVAVLSGLENLKSWAKDHPNGYLIVEYRDLGALEESRFRYHGPYKSHHVGLLSAKTLLENPELGKALKY